MKADQAKKLEADKKELDAKKQMLAGPSLTAMMGGPRPWSADPLAVELAY